MTIKSFIHLKDGELRTKPNMSELDKIFPIKENFIWKLSNKKQALDKCLSQLIIL